MLQVFIKRNILCVALISYSVTLCRAKRGMMRAENFEWWRRRTRGVTRIFHLFRIDHVLGFYRIYAFPWRPSRNAEFLPITFEQMLQRTGGRSPHFMPRDDETAESCEANRRE